MMSNTKDIEKQEETIEFLGKKMTPEEYESSMDNIVGFFNALLKVDKRINPERYKSKNRQT